MISSRLVVDDLDALRRENAAQRAQIAELIATIAKLHERVGELVAIAQRKQRTKTAPSEKKPEPPPMRRRCSRSDRSRPCCRRRPRGRRAPARRTGGSAIPSHLEAEAHRLRPDGCEHCGSTNGSAADEVVEEKLHVVKEHQRRRVVRRTTCRCRDCGKRTTLLSWMATDGTGIKVLVPGLSAAHDGYVELYRNAECAVFQYAAHKGSEDVVAKLAPFRGTLTADAEPSRSLRGNTTD